MAQADQKKKNPLAYIFKKVTVRMDCEHRLKEAEAAYKAADDSIKTYEYQRFMAAQQVAACKAYMKEHYGTD